MRRRGAGAEWHERRGVGARAAVALAVATAAAQGTSWLGWVVLGGAVLAGRFEASAQAAWALLTLTGPVARAVEVAAVRAIGERWAVRLRRRVLAGALTTVPRNAVGGARASVEATAGEGAGRLFGRLLAMEGYESGWLEGGSAVCVATAELGGAGLALSHGLAAGWEVGWLLGGGACAMVSAVGGVAAAQAVRQTEGEWTGRLVEALAGHRTLRMEGWQAGMSAGGVAEEGGAAYEAAVRRFAVCELVLRQAGPGGWLVVGLAVLSLGMAGRAPGAAELALSLGGLMAGRDGLARLGGGLAKLAAAWASRVEAARLWVGVEPWPGGQEAMGGVEPSAGGGDAMAGETVAGEAPVGGGWGGAGQGAKASDERAGGDGGPVLEVRDVVCRAATGGRVVLAGASLEVGAGDRVVLRGPSGAGKSTLAAVLAGRRRVERGVVLLGGYDLPSLGGEVWRRRVVGVGQAQAAHVFAGSLAWNLLLGRGWPPTAEDLAAAAEVCRELGLGQLLERMPGGLDERIGEGGWQVSDGEAARICLARALLQEPEVLIVDDCLGALDPALRRRVVEVIERRARSVVLIEPAEGG